MSKFDTIGHKGNLTLLCVFKWQYAHFDFLITLLNSFLYQIQYPMICVQQCMGNSWFIITIPTIDVSEVQLPNYKCVYSTSCNALDAIEIRIESLSVSGNTNKVLSR